MKAFQDCRYIRLRDQPGVFAACAGSGTAEIQGMCQVFKSGRRRICSLLYRSVSVHLLLGTKGAGSGKGTWHSVQSNPHHRQRIRTERTCTGYHVCFVPGRSVSDPGYSVRQKISGAYRSSGLSGCIFPYLRVDDTK